MQTTTITPAGIAIALAVVVALGLLFFGPRFFSPFNPTATSPVATSTLDTTNASTTMNENQTAQPAAPAGKMNPVAVRADGLEITDITVGTGAEAVAGKTVSVLYTGTLTDGTLFDSTSKRNNAPFEFPLGQGMVIKGWDEGVQGMKVGGKRHLVIPAALGYGNQAVGGVIPANATLVFDVELLRVQ
jgi:FKBP-type peptidyl-prolyl cis-trans isomerase FkpA